METLLCKHEGPLNAVDISTIRDLVLMAAIVPWRAFYWVCESMESVDGDPENETEIDA